MSATSIPPFDPIRETAAAWIARRDQGLTREEEHELRAWRASDPRHDAALARYERLWSNLDRPRIDGATDELRRGMAMVRRQKRRRRAALVGAGLSLAIAASLLWRPHATPVDDLDMPSRIIFVKPQHQTLADGTIVECPVGTRFIADFSATVRQIRLENGEAHFQVARDPLRPFVVRAHGVDIRAIGTAFSVNLGKGTVEVLVTEGKVAVDPSPDSTRATIATLPLEIAPAMVQAGERIVVKIAADRPFNALQSQPISNSDAAERLAWRSVRIEFSGTPLAEVIATINRTNEQRGNPRFVLLERELGELRLSGLFRPDDTEAVIRILESGFGLKAVRNGEKQIEISKGPKP